jgi:hypothetical protein
MSKFVAVLLALFSICSARAQTDGNIVSAMGEVAGELQVCSVYFLVITSCLSDQRPDLARKYREAAEKMIGLAVSSGRAAGVSDAAYEAMNRIDSNAMMKAMGGNCTNVAVLLERYSNFCQRLSQDADPRLKEWITCIRARQQTCGGPGLP